MLQAKLNNIYNEAVEMVLAANIPLEPKKITNITLNTRAKRRWGQCKRTPYGTYEININAELVKQSEEGTLNTIIHELLHASKDGNGHNGKWKEYANTINSMYNINVKRTNTAEEKGIKDPIIKAAEYKYILECQQCNYKFKRMRSSNFVNHPESYTCGCGGRIKRIK